MGKELRERQRRGGLPGGDSLGPGVPLTKGTPEGCGKGLLMAEKKGCVGVVMLRGPMNDSSEGAGDSGEHDRQTVTVLKATG